MPTNFPGSLDNFTNPTPADNLNTPAVLHSDQHANENDAIEAIEAWVGISGTSATASHEYRIRFLENTPLGVSPFGVMGWDEGIPLGTGTTLNFVGENVEATISGSVIRVFVTGTPVAFPQELIGVMGWSAGTPLGTGTVLDVEGASLSLSGTVLRLFVPSPVYPQSQIGIYGKDEGQPLGTGTILNVVGEDVSLSVSGTTLTLTHINPTITFPQEVIGIMGWDEGQPLGTGTILNAVGDNLSLSLSGNVLQLTHIDTPVTFPQEVIGFYAENQGIPLGTGTILNVNGSRIFATMSGTTVELSNSPDPQELIGIYGKDEGQNVGTGTVINVVGENISLSLSGTTLTLEHTNPTITFPQEVIGIYGQDEGINLGTGTVLNVTGENVSLSLSGTVLNLHHTNPAIAFPQELIGIYGLDDGVPLGTGTWIDFGNNLTASLSGTVLRVDASAGGGSFNGVDQIGVYGQNQGVPVGTGTVFNVTETDLNLSRSGTVLELARATGTTIYLGVDGSRLFTYTASGTYLIISNSPDPQELIGIYNTANGIPVGTGSGGMATGTRIDWGNNISVSMSGTTLRVNSAAFPQEVIGVFGRNNGVNLGTGTILEFGKELNAAITGTTLYLHPFDAGTNGDIWVKVTGSVQGAAWVNRDYNIQFFLGDGANVISTGSISAGYGYVDIPYDSIIESWSVVADATGSIVVDILKSTYAGFPPTAPVAGLGQPLLSSKRTNTGNATGTVLVNKTDQLLLSVSSASTIKLATVSLRSKGIASS